MTTLVYPHIVRPSSHTVEGVMTLCFDGFYVDLSVNEFLNFADVVVSSAAALTPPA
jgi:hypothetical protein